MLFDFSKSARSTTPDRPATCVLERYKSEHLKVDDTIICIPTIYKWCGGMYRVPTQRLYMKQIQETVSSHIPGAGISSARPTPRSCDASAGSSSSSSRANPTTGCAYVWVGPPTINARRNSTCKKTNRSRRRLVFSNAPLA